MSKVAILIDGGLFLKRLPSVRKDLDPHDPDAVARAIGQLVHSLHIELEPAPDTETREISKWPNVDLDAERRPTPAPQPPTPSLRAKGEAIHQRRPARGLLRAARNDETTRPAAKSSRLPRPPAPSGPCLPGTARRPPRHRNPPPPRHCEPKAKQSMPHAMKHPAVYIMTNRPNGTLYTGVTSNLPQRVWQHREGALPGFTTRYGLKRLVWFEIHDTMERAILREKQLKGGSRVKKLALVTALNPGWRDLYEDIR